jgi:hypothetical protein
VNETAIYLRELYVNLDVKGEDSAEKAAEYCSKPQASLLKSMLHLLSLILEVQVLPSSCSISMRLRSPFCGMRKTFIHFIDVFYACLGDEVAVCCVDY